MRELNIDEIESVNGAGLIQDSMATAGGFIGKVFGNTGINVVQKVANRYSPTLSAGLDLLVTSGIGRSGETVGHLAGYALGGVIEGALSGFNSSFKKQFEF